MKVWISVHGRFHAFDLAREVFRAGALAGLTTTYPSFLARRHVDRSANIRVCPWLEAYRRFPLSANPSRRRDIAIAAAFARFSARHLDAADIFVGWSGASLEVIPHARALGMKVVIERGSTHIQHQAAVLEAEFHQHGTGNGPVAPEMVHREINEYAAADAIAVPSCFAASTFVSYGIPQEKLIVNPYGADLDRFAPPGDRPRGKRPRVLFVGGLSLRKGARALLGAAARLRDEIELHVVGPLSPEIRRMADELIATRHFNWRGPLRSRALDEAYRDADIFCLPSLEEGFPLALLQAAAAGLPIIATVETGATDILEDGREIVIVPSRDPISLAAALKELASDPDRRRALGAAARARLTRGCSWADYGRRAMVAYGDLLRSSGSPEYKSVP